MVWFSDINNNSYYVHPRYDRTSIAEFSAEDDNTRQKLVCNVFSGFSEKDSREIDLKYIL